MLEQLRLVVHFIPAETHDLDEEQLHEAMAPQGRARRAAAPARVSVTPAYGS